MNKKSKKSKKSKKKELRSIANIREHFEKVIKTTTMFKDNTPLGILEVNGEFIHYMDADTDTMFIGFILGMRYRDSLKE